MRNTLLATRKQPEGDPHRLWLVAVEVDDVVAVEVRPLVAEILDEQGR